ncbi:MAG: primosomal protein N', partial [Bacillota bacterium]|nr:primosomal protein N' [Bacillota bacterium]
MEILAKVCVDTGLMSLDKLYDYRIPYELTGILKIGHMVEVPFGKSRKAGIVVGFSEEASEFKLKAITKITDPLPVVGALDIELAGYMQRMYVASFYDCLKLLCPPGCFYKSDKRVILSGSEESIKKAVAKSVNQERIVAFLEEEGKEANLEMLKSMFGQGTVAAVNALQKKGIVTCESFSENSKGPLKRKYAELIPGSEKKIETLVNKNSVAQIKVCNILLGGPLPITDIIEQTGSSRYAAQELQKKGIVKVFDENIRRNPFQGKEICKTKSLEPTQEQKEALSKIIPAVKEQKNDTFLLHGVTGSGKTEVFMQSIEHVLKEGRTAIVLVPEISLTPQMTDRFLGRFGDKIAILHSVLSQGERLDEWNRIKEGQAKVVIGARSAIFAPLSDIGLIIIDEEHENTYKSEQSPRYNAVEVAKKRCEQNNAVLILASATPDVSSYYKAQNGEYTLITMKDRYNHVNLPNIKVSDMRLELKEGNRSMLSRQLQEEIRINLEKKEQTILFLNRRGFSTFVSCRDCGYVVTCPECSISLTYHKSTETLNCHYCGYRTENIKVCPNCKGTHVRYFGTGTQKLEEEINKLFPDASTIRMDVDTTTTKNSHEKILKRFCDENIDILLGTQMVSKGLDYPNISLVGVVAADMSLNIDDYRAAERTFDLVTQVCGRAGRGDKRGRAVIQTYSPENSVIGYAREQNYEAFYENEIAFRKLFDYPPFKQILCITFSGED